MTINHLKIKNRLRQVLLSFTFRLSPFALLLSAFSSHAQTLVGPTMTGTPAPGSYYNYTGITLTGFRFTASAGNSLHVYIASPDCQLLNTAASADQNYIKTSIPRTPRYVPGVNYSTCDLMQTIQYMDGLGRPVQTVQVKGSPKGMDVVQPIAYDQFGREANKYLPYALTTGTSDGSYKTDALTAGAGQAQFYNPTGSSTLTQQANGVVNTPYPVAVTGFEPSPLNRVIEQGAPGASWQLTTSGVTGSGHTLKIAYGTNAANEVFLWAVNAAGNGIIGNSFYTAGTLYSITTTDENGYTSIEYKDMQGKVVCKKVQLPPGPVPYATTYYIYNDLDNLTYVMPPNPSGAGYPSSILETDVAFANYIYGYHYDQRNRVIRKKIPNKGWEYMIYNKLDQVVLSQDSALRVTNQWIATKYDALGRVIITGLWPAGSQSQSDLQTIYNNAPSWAIWDSRDYTDNTTGYKIVSYALPAQYLTINYYDDYTNLPGFPPDFIISGNSSMTKGLLTATKALVLNTTYNSTLDMLCTAHYYDDLGRSVKTFQQHYLGGAASPYNYDVISGSYNFTNQATVTTRQHYKNVSNAASLSLTIANTYSYDHMGRKTQAFEKINSGMNILLSQTDYNPIGQVMAKHLHGATGAAPFLQDISYKYNERGWLKRINDPAIAPTATRMFSEQLGYDSVKTTTVPKNYNGNIAEQLFQVYGSTLYPGQQNVIYAYDPMNRLNSGISSTTLSETGISYDEIGNIVSLTRNGNTGNYAYANNQLNIISGVTSSPYTYDGNGNVLHDGRTGANVGYNILNLPQAVTATTPTSINITYTYDANGQKLRKVSNGTSTDYISGIQYKPDAATIDFIQTEEGRAINSGGNYTYEYTLTDHLGNNRVTFDQTNGKVGEEDYYPFGLNVHRQINAGNKYLYNKKELQDELTEYDYGARFYDPVIARWTTPDPLAESSRRFSPYSYGGLNPIRYIDVDGMFFDDYLIRQDGTIHKEKTDDKTDSFYLETSSKEEGDNVIRSYAKVATLDKNDNGLDQLQDINYTGKDPSTSFSISVKDGNEEKAYMRGDAVAALIGAASDANVSNLTVVQFSLSDGKSPDPSVSHKQGKNGDLRYVNTNEDGAATMVGAKNLDLEKQSDLNNGLYKYGWKDMVSERRPDGTLLPHTKSAKESHIHSNHKTHLHLQGFKPKVVN